MQFQPLNDNILVRPIKDSQSHWAIALPDNVAGKRGTVVAIGEGRWEGSTLVHPSVNPGDCIAWSAYEEKSVFVGNEVLVLIRQGEILGVYLEDKPTVYRRECGAA